MTGLLTPLTDEIALIEILDTLLHIMPKLHDKMSQNSPLKSEDISLESCLQDIKNFKAELNGKCLV